MPDYYDTMNYAPDLPYARIVRTRGRALDYQLTREDVTWAAKMAAYEGDPEEVLWTMVQRFTLTYPGQRWGSFTEFIRKFSQPINPDWYRGGVHCSSGGKGRGTLYCSEEKLARREHLEQMSWSELEAERPEAVRITLKWAQGGLRNPVPKAVNFAAPERAQEYVATHPDAKIVAKERNWFLTEMGTHHWHPNTVVMRQPDVGTIARAEYETGENLRVFWRTLIDPVPIGSFGKRLV